MKRTANSSRGCRARSFSTADRDFFAFTLVEIMVVVALMSMLILGLVLMFNQTQRAFRAGLTQTDLLEGGRLASGMIVRELEQMTPGDSIWKTNFVGVIPLNYEPLRQTLVATTRERTNFLQDVFFVIRENQTWTGIGYYVRTNTVQTTGPSYIGTLYRYETNITARQYRDNPSALTAGFERARVNLSSNGVTRLLDGVVHFMVRPFDDHGAWITNAALQDISTNAVITIGFPDPNSYPYSYREVQLYVFRSNAVPASVDFELGILENDTYKRYVNIPEFPGPPFPTPRHRFLTEHGNNVHVFRQRVPIRTVNRAAYYQAAK